MSEKFRVELFDTTERDGDQALPAAHQFTPGSKVGIAEQIASLGIGTIEAGFPATAGDGEEVAEVARTVGQKDFEVTPKRVVDGELISDPTEIFTPVITGLTLARPEDIETTWSAVQYAKHPGIHTFVATAEDHMRVKHPGMSKEQILDKAVMAVRHARDVGGDKARIEFSCEAASTTDPVWLERFVRTIIQEDINVINLPDTLGAASARVIRRMFAEATKWVIEEGRAEDITISTHNHNDKERAVSNSIEASHAVCDTAHAMGGPIPTLQIEGASGDDLGERAGNANLPTVSVALLTEGHEFAVPLEFKIDPEKILQVAEYITRAAGLQINPNAAVIGRDMAAHRSGVHAAAVIEGGGGLYIIVDPRWVGHRVAGKVETGKYQGKKGNANLGGIEEYRSKTIMLTSDIEDKVASYGMDVSPESVEQVVVSVNSRARSLGRALADNEIEAYVFEAIGEKVPENRFTLDEAVPHEQKISKNETLSSVTVTVTDRITGETITKSARSKKGMVDAARKALNEAMDFDGDIEDWHGTSQQAGSDAEAGIIAKVRQNGHCIEAYAQNVDIFNASLAAYMETRNLIDRIESRLATAGG